MFQKMDAVLCQQDEMDDIQNSPNLTPEWLGIISHFHTIISIHCFNGLRIRPDQRNFT